MENEARVYGYTTEKIVNAHLGRCIPIYYGSRRVFQIFNDQSFVFYDPHNPQLALDRVRELETNASACAQVMAEKILKDEERTVEEFFFPGEHSW
jgi:hypothetical protein